MRGPIQYFRDRKANNDHHAGHREQTYEEWEASPAGQAWIAEQERDAEEWAIRNAEQSAAGIKDGPEPGTREWYIETGNYIDPEPDWGHNPAIDPVNGNRYYDTGRVVNWEGVEIRGPVVARTQRDRGEDEADARKAHMDQQAAEINSLTDGVVPGYEYTSVRECTTEESRYFDWLDAEGWGEERGINPPDCGYRDRDIDRVAERYPEQKDPADRSGMYRDADGDWEFRDWAKGRGYSEVRIQGVSKQEDYLARVREVGPAEPDLAGPGEYGSLQDEVASARWALGEVPGRELADKERGQL
jgi:hypothetical protein